MWLLGLALLFVAAIGAVCYWRRQTPQDRSKHELITLPHNGSEPLSLTNLPQGSRRGAHNGRVAAILTDGSVMAELVGGTKQFPSVAAYRAYVGDERALQFAEQHPA